MKRILTFLLTLSGSLGICGTAHSAFKPELTLAEFRRMPGVEVFIETDPAGSTKVSIELLDHTNYLGGDFEAAGPLSVTAYIVVRDLEKRFIMEAPLRMERIDSSLTRSNNVKLNFTRIEFRTDPKLLSKVILRFHVQPQKGGQDIEVYFDAHSDKKPQ